MPCGGIVPFGKDNGECWVCRQPGAHHFCFEWDCFLHAHCIPEFLESDEGECILLHNHTVDVDTTTEKPEQFPPFQLVEVGELVGRKFAGMIMPLFVSELTDTLIICGGWKFDRATGAEVDEELGWGPLPLITGSFLA